METTAKREDLPAFLVAFDPGPHTGVAGFTNGRLFFTRTLVGKEGVQDIPSLYQKIANVFEYAASQDVVVVYEDFRTMYSPTHDGLNTIKIIGFIEGLVAMRGFRLVQHYPFTRKPFQAVAERAAPKSADRHARDAIAQGLAFLARSCMYDWTKLEND